MTNQRMAGWILILAAFAMLAINMSDAFADLSEWHYATTPQFVAVFLKQTGMVIMSAIGGKMLKNYE